MTVHPTRGVLYVHSSAAALLPHIESALANILGMPVTLHWTAQPAQPGTWRTEYSWSGDSGTAAALASAMRGWERLRFEVTEDKTAHTEGIRYSYTPSLGIFQAVTGIHGDILSPKIDSRPPSSRQPWATPRWSRRSTSCSASHGTTNSNPSGTPETARP